jgi:urease beta subunit
VSRQLATGVRLDVHAATSVCVEPLRRCFVVEIVRRLGGFGVSLIAGAVIVVVLGVAGVGDPLVP